MNPGVAQLSWSRVNSGMCLFGTKLPGSSHLLHPKGGCWGWSVPTEPLPCAGRKWILAGLSADNSTPTPPVISALKRGS